MNYHNITKNDMLNGDGLRVVLWVSGCDNFCDECQNPQTWNKDSGILFDESAKQELFDELDKDYISGITLSGGDPFMKSNRKEIELLVKEIATKYPNKTIWAYTGKLYEDLLKEEDMQEILPLIDVLLDGKYVKELRCVSEPWVGSTNQRVIKCKESLKTNQLVLLDSEGIKTEQILECNVDC